MLETVVTGVRLHYQQQGLTEVSTLFARLKIVALVASS